MKKIILTDLPKLEKPDLKKIVADCGLKQEEGCVYCTPDQLYSVCDSLWNQMDAVYAACMKRMSAIVQGVNEALEEHIEGHLPPMERSQKLAVLDAAGIADQFEVELPELDPELETIWASKKGDRNLAQAIKIEAK